MERHSHPVGNHCSDCSECPLGESMDDGPSRGVVQGWRFAATSAGLFLTPIVLGMFGASVAGEQASYQLLGAVSGFSVGIVGSVLISRLVQRRNKESA